MGLRCEKYRDEIGTSNANWIARTELGTREQVLALHNIRNKGRPDQVKMRCFEVGVNNPLEKSAAPTCSNCEFIRT